MKDNKVYTKTGDDGTSGLLGGKRIPKHHTRLKAYGTIDELISWLGLINDLTEDESKRDIIFKIQNEMMRYSALLAVESDNPIPSGLLPIQDEEVLFLENQIDKITEKLPPLKHFIIPGGNVLISYTHLARCVCRRAERLITELNESEPVAPLMIAYINRLSDYLFMLSRAFANDLGVAEIKWKVK